MFDQIVSYWTFVFGIICGGLCGIVLTLIFLKVYNLIRYRKVPKDIQRTLMEVRKKVPLDPVKRRSLQPGKRPIPKGFRETLPFEKPPEPIKPVSHINPKERKKPPTLPLKNSFTEKQERAIEEGGFYHKFYGSQLIVGTTPLVQNLATQSHALEITKGGQLFIDNIPYEVNPSDVHRIKEELMKMR